MSDAFLDPRLTLDNLDRYLARSAILKVLTENLPHFSGTLLDVGCGRMPYKQLLGGAPSRVSRYVGLDLAGGPYDAAPDLLWDGRVIPLADDVMDCALMTEVLEHCPDPAAVLAQVHRVLKPGGFVLITVPFLWPLHDVPHDFQRLTPFALRRLFEGAGFAVSELGSLGGWDQSVAQMVGLWVRRRAMRAKWRTPLSVAVWPLVRLLGAKDWDRSALGEGQMITGMYCTARKR